MLIDKSITIVHKLTDWITRRIPLTASPSANATRQPPPTTLSPNLSRNTTTSYPPGKDGALLQLLLDIAVDLAQASLEDVLRILIIRLQHYYVADHACLHFTEPAKLRDEILQAGLAACPVHEASLVEKKTMAQIEGAAIDLAIRSGKPIPIRVAQQEVTGWERLAQAAGIADGIAIPLIYQREPFGVLNLYFSTPRSVANPDVAALRTLGNLTYGAIQRELRLRALREHEDAIAALAEAIEAKDHFTGGHVGRVVRLATSLGKAIGLSHREIRLLRQAAVLHDVGKIGVPEAVLNKPGELTQEERALIRQHPETGARILSHLDTSGIDQVIAAVRGHHERWDGTGYPDELAGEEIPLLARIIAVADTYDALTSDRPYRPAYSQERALDILIESRGKHLDRRLMDLFIEKRLYQQGDQ